MPPKHRSPQSDEGYTLRAAGPLRKLVSTEVADDPKDESPRPISYRGQSLHDHYAANALVVLRRIAFLRVEGKGAGQTSTPDQKRTASRTRLWAAERTLGQEFASELLAAVRKRRSQFVERWVESGQRDAGAPVRYHRRLILSTEWRVAIGLGDHYGIHESGIALHGTYGIPILPGSALGGLTAAAARADDAATDTDIHRIFGSPRPGENATVDNPAGLGNVRFLDALPSESVAVHDDVITPHQKPYYNSGDGAAADGPGEHHQPEPTNFLSVSGSFQLDLLGEDERDLRRVVIWLTKAGEDIGIGGRTTAGYGYFTIDLSPVEHT